MNCGPTHNHTPTEKRTNKILLWIIVAVAAAYYLWGWHRDHVLQYWPLAIALLCPLMHLFGHGGHEGHASDKKEVSR